MTGEFSSISTTAIVKWHSQLTSVEGKRVTGYANDSCDFHKISRDGSRKFLQTRAKAKRSLVFRKLHRINSHIFSSISVMLRQWCMLFGAYVE